MFFFFLSCDWLCFEFFLNFLFILISIQTLHDHPELLDLPDFDDSEKDFVVSDEVIAQVITELFIASNTLWFELVAGSTKKTFFVIF